LYVQLSFNPSNGFLCDERNLDPKYSASQRHLAITLIDSLFVESAEEKARWRSLGRNSGDDFKNSVHFFR